MKKKIYSTASLALIMALLIQPFQSIGQKKDNPLKGFDSFVESTMKDWNVPALGIAIVKDGEILLTKGYGYADIDNKRKADAKTLFGIGSSSKAFTAASIMQLVDEKKLDLDKPVRTYLPDFKLFDEYTTNHITTRDLLSHQSGLPRHDLAWYGSDASRKTLYNRLQHLEPTAELRQTWQYQNLMYMTAGYLAGQIEDETWEENIQRKLLAPLGMSATNFSVEKMQKNANHALPYKVTAGEPHPIPFRNLDAIAPAGAINSNAEDMAKWLQLLLNEGNFDGQQVISAASMKQLYQPQMTMPGSIGDDDIFYNSYGLGWMINSYRGRLRVEHGGNIDGFTASVCFMPRHGIGVVVLANMNGTMLNAIVRNNVIDRLTGMEIKDWNSILLEQKKKADAAANTAEAEDVVLIPNTKPSLELKEYIGKYENPGYGMVEVLEKENSLFIVMNGSERVLTHYHFDVFEAETLIGKFKFQFQMNMNGEISSLHIPVEPALQKSLPFKRLPTEMKISDNDLKIYEGKYVFPQANQAVVIRLKDGVLTASIPGQPTYTLVPSKEHQFSIKELDGFDMKFTVEDEKSTKVTFIQPNGNFTFTRE